MSLDPLIEAGWPTALHVAFALGALALGIVQFALPKGGPRHRTMGRAWALLMLGAAVTAPLIGGWEGMGDLSALHLLIPLTLFGLWEGVRHARAHERRAHALTMTLLFGGALVVAGGFAVLVPGRVMHAVLGL